MLYTPYFAKEYFNQSSTRGKYSVASPRNSQTSIAGGNLRADQRLPAANSSLQFYGDLFDLGIAETKGRMLSYEMDFMRYNFEQYPLFFEGMGAADQWFAGMADAASSRNLSVQYCLPGASDVLQSLWYDSVTQGRASGDYGFASGPEGMHSSLRFSTARIHYNIKHRIASTFHICLWFVQQARTKTSGHLAYHLCFSVHVHLGQARTHFGRTRPRVCFHSGPTRQRSNRMCSWMPCSQHYLSGQLVSQTVTI